MGRRQDWMFITEFYISHATLSELRQINSATFTPGLYQPRAGISQRFQRNRSDLTNSVGAAFPHNNHFTTQLIGDRFDFRFVGNQRSILL